MNDRPNQPNRVRLTVEHLEGRELPSTSLSSLSGYQYNATLSGQTRYGTSTPWRTWTGTSQIIGILVAL